MSVKPLELPQLPSDYLRRTGRLGNQSYFGSLCEYLSLVKEETGDYSRALDSYDNENAYIYRSSDMYGTNGYGRLNTCFAVFCSPFDSSQAAFSFLNSTGLIDIAERDRGVVLLLPPRSQNWNSADVQQLEALELGSLESMMDYLGFFSHNYFIGINEGSTFINTYLANTPKITQSISACLCIGGDLDDDHLVPSSSDFGYENLPFPVWHVGAAPRVIEFYKSIFRLKDSSETEEDGIYKLSSPSVRQALLMSSDNSLPLNETIKFAYDSFMKDKGCVPIGLGINAFLDGSYWAHGVRYYPEALEIVRYAHEDGQTVPDTEIIRWYEYIPKEYIGTTSQKCPLILLLHGHCDDPNALVEECGFLELAAKERVMVVAPDHQDINDVDSDNCTNPDNKAAQFIHFLDYLMVRYPFIDPTRIYVTGFSRGGMNTCVLSAMYPHRFAAAAPLAGLGFFSLSRNNSAFSLEHWTPSVSIPAYIMLCGRDPIFAERHGLGSKALLGKGKASTSMPDAVNMYLISNGYPPLSEEQIDFSSYPFLGFPTKPLPCKQDPEVFFRRSQLPLGDTAQPVLFFDLAEGLSHSLYYGYAENMWDFCKHYRRESQDKDSVYS